MDAPQDRDMRHELALSKIELWDVPATFGDSKSAISQLCVELLRVMKLTGRHIATSLSISNFQVRSFERTAISFILWVDGHDVAKGGLDSAMDQSWSLKKMIWEFMIKLGKVLIDDFMPRLKFEDRHDSQISALRMAYLEAKASFQEQRSARKGHNADSSSDESDSDSDTGSESSYTASSKSFDEIIADLDGYIKCLMELDPFIRGPAPDQVEQSDVTLQDEHTHVVPWSPHQLYSDRIIQRFPRAEQELVERLARANWDRFQRAQEAKRDRLPATHEEDEGAAQVLEVLSQSAASTKFKDSALGTSLGSTPSGYAETVMAYGQSDEDHVVRVPPLPEGARDGTPFDCTACGKLVWITNNRAWKKHLYSDLRPWLCHDADCELGSQPFASRDEWIQHLSLDHGFQGKWNAVECPLCNESTGEGKSAVLDHLGGHMEEISLASLPAGADSHADPESDRDDNASDTSDSSTSEQLKTTRKTGSSLLGSLPSLQAQCHGMVNHGGLHSEPCNCQKLTLDATLDFELCVCNHELTHHSFRQIKIGQRTTTLGVRFKDRSLRGLYPCSHTTVDGDGNPTSCQCGDWDWDKNRIFIPEECVCGHSTWFHAQGIDRPRTNDLPTRDAPYQATEERDGGMPRSLTLPESSSQEGTAQIKELYKKLKPSEWRRIYSYARSQGYSSFDMYIGDVRVPWVKVWKEIRHSGAHMPPLDLGQRHELPPGVTIQAILDGGVTAPRHTPQNIAPNQLEAEDSPPKPILLPGLGSSRKLKEESHRYSRLKATNFPFTPPNSGDGAIEAQASANQTPGFGRFGKHEEKGERTEPDQGPKTTPDTWVVNEEWAEAQIEYDPQNVAELHWK